MTTTTPVDRDSPLYQAWLRYRESADYANTKQWATHDEHTEGSLWAAFEQGFRASQPSEGKEPVAITGLWLRRRDDNAEALVELDGEWRKVITERYDGAFSHIAEPSGIRNAPVDAVPVSGGATQQRTPSEDVRCAST